jgi:hypothetical protein
VGALFIVATVCFSLSVVILEPVLESPGFLVQASTSGVRVPVGILLELINHIAVVGIAVVIFPVLKPFSERLAVGYVVARSIEAVLFAIGTMHLLLLVFVSHEFVAAGSPSPSYFHTLGGIMLAGHDWNSAPLAFTAFSLGALMLNYALFRIMLVPRWISTWGMLGAVSILAARILPLSGFGVSTSAVTILDSPIFLQEMVLAMWLIVRGFETPDSGRRTQRLVPDTE